MPDEVFTWKARLEDGAVVDESILGSHLELFRRKLRVVEFSLIDTAGRLRASIALDPSRQRLIYRKRWAKGINHPRSFVVHLVGWQETRDGVNIQQLAFIFPDGSIHLRDRFDKAAPFMDSIEFYPEEKDAGMG